MNPFATGVPAHPDEQTENDDQDRELMRRFDIIGPPAILFFDRNGVEMKPYRLVGYFDPVEFSGHLRQVLAAK